MPLTKCYLDICSSFSLEQLSFIPNRINDKTVTLIDHVITSSSQNVSQYSVIESSISDHNLVFFPIKTPSLKFNKHSDTSIRSMENYTNENFL